MKEISHERLKQLLNYDGQTGVFTWRINRGGGAKAGARAGNLRTSDGYIQIKVQHRLWLAHVLAVFWTTGTAPESQVDHVNGIRSDNRIENLRAATKRQNIFNQGVRSDNKSGMKGVCWLKRNRKWRAQIQADGKKFHVGLFDTVAEASAAYELKASELFGEFKRAC